MTDQHGAQSNADAQGHHATERTEILLCQTHGCGNRATCLGAYEGAEEETYRCDTCCGHGCEDGWCWSLDELAEEAS